MICNLLESAIQKSNYSIHGLFRGTLLYQALLCCSGYEEVSARFVTPDNFEVYDRRIHVEHARANYTRYFWIWRCINFAV